MVIPCPTLNKWPPPCLVLPRSSPLPPLSPPPRRTRSFFCCVSRRSTLARIQSSGVIACLRATSADLAMEAARAALIGGISVVLQQLVHDYPTTVLGVGTVLSVKDAKKAVGAGAKFLMSPAMVKDVMDGFQSGEVLYIPGAMTPTEILSAHDAGAKMVKVYPVSALGGVKYISAIKKPFPHISMVASQGITVDSIGEYIAKGASSVVLSDAIFNKEAMGEKNFEAIHKLASFAAMQGKEAVEGVALFVVADIAELRVKMELGKFIDY
ncbi:KHG/KDPG aldolase [Morus notabilis]|uniref:KHG/KDPG aldolase n=1 Tax=Morus notabilis TaxID=981085 RepID=W9R8R4_9ROSA|nr:KHG/KDPG aldolase [Morus notabilis]